MNPAVTNRASKLIIDDYGKLHSRVAPIPKLQRSLSIRDNTLSRQSSYTSAASELFAANEFEKGKSCNNIDKDEEELRKLIEKINLKKKQLQEPPRHSVDIGTSSRINNSSMENNVEKRRIKGYVTRTISEPVYEDETNMRLENCLEITGTNPNSIYISVEICLKEYNEYSLCAYIDSGCSVCFGKRTLFP